MSLSDTDTVSLSSSLVISGQSIGAATSSSGLDVDGILGLGPTDLTMGTVAGTSQVPTVVDNLYSQKKISSAVVGISYNPVSSSSQSNGELSFGGVDSSKFTGSITYAPITKQSPAKHYWGLDQTITYGSSGANVLSSTAGILDTGTTLTLLATDAFNRYKQLTGATYDSRTGLHMLTNAQFQNLQSLYFQVGSTKFELNANAQIWPRSLNTEIGGSAGNVYLIVGDVRFPRSFLPRSGADYIFCSSAQIADLGWTSSAGIRSSSAFTRCMTQVTTVSDSRTLRTPKRRQTDSKSQKVPTPKSPLRALHITV